MLRQSSNVSIKKKMQMHQVSVLLIIIYLTCKYAVVPRQQNKPQLNTHNYLIKR